MKKIFSLAVACCLAVVGIVFSSCQGMQTSSSYQFGYETMGQGNSMIMISISGTAVVID